jgi:hypothetical protein
MIEISYAALPMDSNTVDVVFGNMEKAQEWLSGRLAEKRHTIFLLAYEGYEKSFSDGYGELPIIVIDDPYLLMYYFYFLPRKATKFFIQEYESYEDAYSVALSMMEHHPKCYNND